MRDFLVINDNKIKKKLILMELNEINFDLVGQYINDSTGLYTVFEKMLIGSQVCTHSELKYEYLEPWIQWPTVHTGLNYDEHKIFRLGDILYSKAPQIFEVLEQKGVRVGVLSAMNAENRLKNPAYFIPDPWTKTPADSAIFSNLFAETIRQVVNENAQSKFTFKSLIILFYSLIRYAKVRHYNIYISLALRSRGARWRRALFLDLLLHDVHMSLFSFKNPQFSTIFLNAGAHIQHHYFFNSKQVKKQTNIRNPDWYIEESEDPIAEMLKIYDVIVGEYLGIPGTEVIVATGLSQKPFDQIKFYYRLKNHVKFLEKVGIKFRQVLPRMTRDFLIEFDNFIDAEIAMNKMSKIYINNENFPLFGSIDNRGKSLFVTLTYPKEIFEGDQVFVGSDYFRIKPYVSFVAVKNGMHQGKGFAFFSEGVSKFAPKGEPHIKELFGSILSYFDISY